MIPSLARWFDRNILELGRELRLSYLPPLMVYLAAGVSGLTGIVGTFFVKEYLGLSAAFLAALGFWAGIPWALKMPLGHLVDLIWRWKSLLVWLGAGLIAASLLIMVGLIGHREAMTAILPAEVWFVISALLAPVGYVVQDVVADAMTVEAVPAFREDGSPFSQEESQRMHVTMQTLGRIAIVGGSALVAGTGGWLAKVFSYELMYQISLVIPVISVLGVVLAAWMNRRRRRKLRRDGFSEAEIRRILETRQERPPPNWPLLGGSAVFVAVTLAVGLSEFGFKEEVILFGSLAIILFLMHLLLREMPPAKRREILGIAFVVFVFRAMPTAGAGPRGMRDASRPATPRIHR